MATRLTVYWCALFRERSARLDRRIMEDREEKETMTYSKIMEQKISSMLEEAMKLHQDGDPKGAVAKLTRTIALDPTNADLFKQRAEAYATLQDFHSAIINLRKALTLQPDEHTAITGCLASLHYLYGKALSREEEYERALEVFGVASEYRPGEKKYTMQRMVCLLSLHRYKECADMIQKELEADDSNPHLYTLRAQVNMLFGNTTQAFYDACSALDLDPDHSEAAQLKQQLEEKAIACKNQAVQYSLVGKRAEAVKKITSAIETDPTMAEFHMLRGALYRRMRDFNAAVEDFLLAMDKCGHRQDCAVYVHASRQLVLTYNDFAVECFQKRFFSEAVTLLNKAIKEEKREEGLYLNRGDCFYRTNNLPFALADYQQALELAPSDWNIQCRIAVVCCELGVELFRKGAFTEAEQQFTSALHYNSKVCRFYVCRARARHELKDTAGTKEDILAALLLDPANEECLPLLARVFPGKTKNDLIQSHEAETVMSKLHSQTSNKPLQKEYTEPSLLEGLPCDIELQFAGSDVELALGDGSSQTERRSAGDSREELSLRQWDLPLPDCVGHTPPPAAAAAAAAVMPPLKSCIQESEFHSMIYYSKKHCTEEVERVLKSPVKFGSRSAKIETISDIKFGERTVIASSNFKRTK